MKIRNAKRNLRALLGSTKVDSSPKIDMHVHYLPELY